MAVYQLLQTLSYGDAVGNETLIIKRILTENCIVNDIFAESFVGNCLVEGKYIENFPKVTKDDVVIYHFAISCKKAIDLLKNINCHKIIIYHNVTPDKFFTDYNFELSELCINARAELKALSGIVDYCIADSEYNKQELIEVGYKCKIDVLPLLIPFEDYDKAPSAKVLQQYMDDGYTNLLFVGRIAPNKKQEDIIKVFNYYKKNINPKSRLIFVGNATGMESYYEKLQYYVKALELDDVIFTGHIGFDDILAYYRLADVFLCMSEHEGFGVPLVEAMYFEIPIIAYNSSAIPWVLGDSGVLVDNKNSILWAKLIERILNDEELGNEILMGQRNRLADFSFEKTRNLFLKYLSSFQIGANI